MATSEDLNLAIDSNAGKSRHAASRRRFRRVPAILTVILGMLGTSLLGVSAAQAQDIFHLAAADFTAVQADCDVRQPECEEVVPLPELGAAHRLPSGGLNLWRVPVSELEDDYGQPRLVRNLETGGFSYDRSKTIVGNFGDVTADDDGTADHVIYHSQPDGSVLVWGVGGGGDTTPQLWADLRTGGWNWAQSRLMAGDITNDGWDDLVVAHRMGMTSDFNLWVLASNGQRLTAPTLWGSGTAYPFDRSRFLLGDLDGDGPQDVAVVSLSARNGVDMSGYFSDSGHFTSRAWLGTQELGGWSFDNSRQVIGDVDGDGAADIIHTHAQAGNPGMLVWVSRDSDPTSQRWFEPAELWQDLRSGGWSYAGSRQHAADTNGDWLDDLISVHSQTGNPGHLVWRHVSQGTTFAQPQVVADL